MLKEKILVSYMFKRTRHTDFFPHFSVCFKEPDIKNPQVVTTAMLLAAYE